MIILIAFCVVLSIVVGLLIHLLNRAIEINRNYEEFYNETIGDVDEVIGIYDELLYRRQLLSDDQDVRLLYKSASTFRDILASYAHAKYNKEKDTKKETGEQQQNSEQREETNS